MNIGNLKKGFVDSEDLYSKGLALMENLSQTITSLEILNQLIDFEIGDFTIGRSNLGVINNRLKMVNIFIEGDFV
jgi:hypothetical protein